MHYQRSRGKAYRFWPLEHPGYHFIGVETRKSDGAFMKISSKAYFSSDGVNVVLLCGDMQLTQAKSDAIYEFD